ncbi:LOW QUALITY PROTEIN: calcium permeable stress-gated cation channel 1-like [Amphiura filiformis]|uniref:LOW QUALITY PROTEIN: calcium permeable stress-gated cation channel 1-like n=1 Tax=Amphiura filiformis TaxID=82378 RepID=UPI003B21CAA2
MLNASVSAAAGSASENCNLWGKNNTLIAFLKYGGIPQNIAYNILFYVILIVLFAIFRKIAGEYGRIALVQHGEERYRRQTSSNGNSSSPLNIQNPPESQKQNGYNVWTSMFYGDHSKSSRTQQGEKGGEEDEILPGHSEVTGICDWIPAMFKIRDEEIVRKSGTDAVQYLQFQRYLIVLMVIIVVLSLGVILPVNFSGTQEVGADNFGRTTISNIPNQDNKLWVHTIFCMLYFIITILFMRHFTTHLPYREESETVSNTMFVTGIPLERTDAQLIKQHFQEAYPDVIVTDVQFAFDIAKLKRLDTQRRDAHLNLLHCETLYQRSGERPLLRAGVCGQIGCCDFIGGPQVDAIEYYSNLEESLTREVMDEKRIALQSNLGMAFVTVHSEAMGTKIVNDYATFKTGPPTVSSVSKQLHSTVWQVHFAPKPDDIIWENLSVSTALWWLSVILVNIALVILLFFLTTPAMFLTALDTTNFDEAVANAKSPFISQFLPTLLLWTFAALLPLLVVYSSYYFEFHWKRTTLNHTIMCKTFVFLLIMVLVLPSLGLASVQAFFEYSLQTAHNIKLRWGCIFLPENGAFFVNYIITSAFIGTALELIRFPELFLYAITMIWTRSEAEKITARKHIVYEFQYGVQYAWMLTTFAIVLVYSITCPLVAPFGLIYIVQKHLVDRYNIYFAYGPSRINRDIHQTAVNFVVIAGIVLLLSVLFFSVLRLGSVDPRSILLFVFLVLCIGLYIAKVCFNIWMGYVPPAYDEFSNIEEPEEKDENLTNFVPEVLQEGYEDRVDEPQPMTRQAYGTMDTANDGRISYRQSPSPESSSTEEGGD